MAENLKTSEDIMDEIAEDVEKGQLYLSMADIYRRARKLYNLQDFSFDDNTMKAPNKLCIEHAVNVARWMPAVPHLDYTRYSTVYLWWKFNNYYVSMEFFPNKVKVIKVTPDQLENSYEHTQSHAGNIQIDMLFTTLLQTATEAGFQLEPIPQPWDEFSGVSVPDLPMDEIERRERKAGEDFAQAFAKSKKEREESGDYTELNREEIEKMMKDSSYATAHRHNPSDMMGFNVKK